MIDFETAKEKVVQYANEKYGKTHKKEYVFDEKTPVIEKQSLWYISFIEKNLEERVDWMGAAKGYIVDKVTGELFQPGSRYSLKTWIWGFELGFRDKCLDLTITKINNEEQTLKILGDFGINFVRPVLECGIIWKVPETYSKEELRERIRILPCTFENQGLTIKLWVLKELESSKAFEYQVNPTKSKYKNITGELLDENNLIKEA
jgi:hypothetical protein